MQSGQSGGVHKYVTEPVSLEWKAEAHSETRDSRGDLRRLQTARIYDYWVHWYHMILRAATRLPGSTKELVSRVLRAKSSASCITTRSRNHESLGSLEIWVVLEECGA